MTDHDLGGEMVVYPPRPSRHLLPEWWIAKNAWDFWAEYDDGKWEPATHQAIDDYVTPGSTYVDVGAWIGPTVLWAAPRAGRIIAVEPDPIAVELLIQNLAEYDNVEIVVGAIADHTGVAELAPHGEGFGSSMSRLAGGINQNNVWDMNAKVVVSCWTLQDLFDVCELEDVSLVKMDIEGGELEVLPTVCPFLAELGIPFLVSLHQEWHATTFDTSALYVFSEVNGDPQGNAPILCVP